MVRHAAHNATDDVPVGAAEVKAIVAADRVSVDAAIDTAVDTTELSADRVSVVAAQRLPFDAAEC